MKLIVARSEYHPELEVVDDFLSDKSADCARTQDVCIYSQDILYIHHIDLCFRVFVLQLFDHIRIHITDDQFSSFRQQIFCLRETYGSKAHNSDLQALHGILFEFKFHSFLHGRSHTPCSRSAGRSDGIIFHAGTDHAGIFIHGIGQLHRIIHVRTGEETTAIQRIGKETDLVFVFQIHLLCHDCDLASAIGNTGRHVLMTLRTPQIQSVDNYIDLRLVLFMTADSSCINGLFLIIMPKYIIVKVCSKSPVLLRIVIAVQPKEPAAPKKSEDLFHIICKTVFLIERSGLPVTQTHVILCQQALGIKGLSVIAPFDIRIPLLRRIHVALVRLPVITDE